MIDKVKLGKHIARLRKQKGLSQKDLSLKLNISFQAISKWERGLSLPDIEMLSKISKVFNTSLGYFLFEVSSSMQINELIDSVNKYGINESNYKSIGALVQSDVFNLSIIKKFNNDNVKSVLESVYSHKEDYEKYSLVNISHKIFKMYADLLDISFLKFNEIVINDIKILRTELSLEDSYILIGKFVARVIEKKYNTAVLLVNTDKDKIHFMTRCTHDLIKRGFNCFYIAQLISQAVIKPRVVSGSSGGGKQGYSGFNLDIKDLRDNYIEVSNRLFAEYILNFEYKFEVSIIYSDIKINRIIKNDLNEIRTWNSININIYTPIDDLENTYFLYQNNDNRIWLSAKKNNILIADIDLELIMRDLNICIRVNPRYQAQGYGEKIYNKAIEYIIKNNYDFIRVVAGIETSNISSVKMFSKLGFELNYNKDGFDYYIRDYN